MSDSKDKPSPTAKEQKPQPKEPPKGAAAKSPPEPESMVEILVERGRQMGF